MTDDKDDARVESQPSVAHGDLPRPATGPSKRALPDMDLQFKDAAMRLIEDRAFRADLDALSGDVLGQVEALGTKHMETLLACGWTPEYVDELIAMLCGWILGFELDDHSTKEEQLDRAMKRMMVAAVAAGWSGGNCRHIYESAKH